MTCAVNKRALPWPSLLKWGPFPFLQAHRLLWKGVGPLAQLVELRTFNPQVAGSSPAGPTVEPPSGGSFQFYRLALDQLSNGAHSLLKLLCGHMLIFGGSSGHTVLNMVLEEREGDVLEGRGYR